MADKVLIRTGELSGRIYAITRWHVEGDNIVADEKHDVTDQLQPLIDSAEHTEAGQALVQAARMVRDWFDGGHPSSCSSNFATGPDPEDSCDCIISDLYDVAVRRLAAGGESDHD